VPGPFSPAESSRLNCLALDSRPSALDHDEQRDTWLAARGFHIIRFRNQELDENIRAVVDAIERAIDELELQRESPLPNPTRRGEPNHRSCYGATIETNTSTPR
jgi:hypothetical protein